MSDELKPCPLCGGPVLIHRRTDGQVDGIVCDECLLTLEAVDVYPEWHTLDELVLRWNARAAVTDEQFSLAVHDGRVWQVARTCGEYRGNVYETTDGTSDDIELWCEHCDIPLEDGWRHCPNCGAKVTR